MSASRRRAFALFVRHRPAYLAGVVCLLITSGLNLSVPALLGTAFAGLGGEGEPSRLGRLLGIPEGGLAPDGQSAFLLRIAVAIVGVAALRAVFRTISRLLVLGSSRRVVALMRETVFDHLQRLPVSFFDRTPTGDVVSRVINDLRHVQGLFGPVTMNLTNTISLYVMALAWLLWIDWQLTLLALAPYVFLAAVVKRYSKRMHSESTDAQAALSRLSSYLTENLNGITVVKSYRRELAEIDRFDGFTDDYYEANRRFARTRAVLVPLMGVVGSSGIVVVLALGGLRVISGDLGLGDFVAFMAALGMLAWPAIALGWVLNGLQRGRAALDRIEELLQEPEEPQRDPAATDPEVLPLEARDLSFTHAGAEEPSLSGVSFRLEAGRWLGIVGRTGSGKSTLVDLLTGLRPPPPGRLFLNDRDALEIPPAVLRRAAAAVSQQGFLFSRSVRDNVAYALDGDASEERIRGAVAGAGFTKDLPQLPQELDTVVGERGVTLSGGQRQRVTLARALILQSPVLVLDDSLSAVDAETEEEILGSLSRLRESGGGAAVIVAHRLSAVRHCDEILVLEGGRVIERGTHAELLKAGGSYATTWREQQLQRELAETD